MQDKSYKEIKPDYTGVTENMQRTTAMQVDKVARDSAVRQQNISNFSQAISNLGAIAKTSQEINIKANQKKIMSGETALTNLALKYQNDILEIEAMKIPKEEKLAKKMELQQNYDLRGQEIIQSVKNNPAMFSNALGTKENFDNALESLSQKQQALQLQIRADNQKTQQEYDTSIAVVNIANNVKNISSAKNGSMLNKTTNESIASVKNALESGFITEAQAFKLYSEISYNENNRAVDVFLDNQTDKLLRGTPREAVMQEVLREYNLSVAGRNFSKSYGGVRPQVDRILANEKLRKFLSNQEADKVKPQIVGYNVSLDEATTSVRENIDNNPAYKDLSEADKNKLKAQAERNLIEQIQKRDNPTNADYTMELMNDVIERGIETYIDSQGNQKAINPNNPKDVSEYQKANGIGHYSSLNTKQIQGLKLGYEQIFTGAEIDLPNKANEWINNRIKELGSIENLEKEARYHLSDTAYTMVKSLKNNGGEFNPKIFQMLEYEKTSRKRGIIPIEVNQKTEIEKELRKTDLAKFYLNSGQADEYNKLLNAVSQYSLTQNTKKPQNEVKNFVEAISGNRDFIVQDGVAVQFDSKKYTDKAQIKRKVNDFIRKPELFTNIIRETDKGNTLDLSSMLFIEGDGDEIVLYAKPTGFVGKVEAGRMSIDDLLSINTEYNKPELSQKQPQTLSDIATKDLKKYNPFKVI